MLTGDSMYRSNDTGARLLVVRESAHGSPPEPRSDTVFAQPALSHASISLWVASLVLEPRPVSILAQRRTDGCIKLAEVGSRHDVERRHVRWGRRVGSEAGGLPRW